MMNKIMIIAVMLGTAWSILQYLLYQLTQEWVKEFCTKQNNDLKAELFNQKDIMLRRCEILQTQMIENDKSAHVCNDTKFKQLTSRIEVLENNKKEQDERATTAKSPEATV